MLSGLSYPALPDVLLSLFRLHNITSEMLSAAVNLQVKCGVTSEVSLECLAEQTVLLRAGEEALSVPLVSATIPIHQLRYDQPLGARYEGDVLVHIASGWPGALLSPTRSLLSNSDSTQSDLIVCILLWSVLLTSYLIC